jgi:hypothetical protein
MAKTKPTTYIPDAQYNVALAGRVDLYGQAFYPGHHVTLRGDVLASLDPAKIQSAEQVTPSGA